MAVAPPASLGPIIVKRPLRSPATIGGGRAVQPIFCLGEFVSKIQKNLGRNGGRRFAPISYRLVTFAACRPLGPEVTSNSTAWPSFNDLYPSA
jgi:hypothetical protein